MLTYQETADGIFYVTSPDKILDQGAIDGLKYHCSQSKLGRARYCLHDSPDSSLHGMVIAHRKGSYDRPHLHITRVEFLVALEGKGQLVHYNDDGTIARVIPFGAEKGSSPLIMIGLNFYHSLIIESDYLIVFEATSGPFNPQSSQPAPWSADPSDSAAIARHFLCIRDHHDD